MIRNIDDAELEKSFGLLDCADTDRLSDLMRMVGLNPLTDLRYADVRGANFSDQDFAHADLEGADLHLAQMVRAKLSAANLHGADLSYSNLSHADLSHADLSDANLSNADLSDADLSGAIMTGAKLDGANLSGTNFGTGHGAGGDLAGSALGVNQSESTSFVMHLQESLLEINESPIARQPVPERWRTQVRVAETAVGLTNSLGGSSGSGRYAAPQAMVPSALTASSAAPSGSDPAYRAVESAVQTLADRALQLSEARSSDTPSLTQLARTHPMSALAIAASAGYALAKLFTRRD